MPAAAILARTSLAIVVAAFGWVTAQQTIGLGLRRNAPDAAYRLAGWDARVAARRAEQQIEAIADPSRRKSAALGAALTARQSLSRDPTIASAATTLALAADIEGRRDAARRLVAYSQRLSRRDLRAHLWLIEAAVTRDDVPGALRHYDMALRTSRVAPDVLFPVLSGALTEASVRAGVVTLLMRDPPWKNLFLNWLGSNAAERPAALLFGEARRAGIAIPASAAASLIGGLARGGAYAEAWNLYAAGRKGISNRQSRQPAFERIPAVSSPFDWNFTAEDGVSGAVQQGPAGPVLAFQATTGVGGVAARQLQVLPPGRYVLQGSSAELYRGGERPFWRLACTGGSEIARAPLLAGANRLDQAFSVPQGCPAQWLTLHLPALDQAEPVSGTVTRILIAPVNGTNTP